MRAGTLRHVVTFQNPGAAVPDGDGGWTQAWTDLTPAEWRVSIAPATARDLERVAAGTVLSTASHLIRGRYHSGITTQTRMIFDGRTFSITGVQNIDELGVEMALTAVEVVT